MRIPGRLPRLATAAILTFVAIGCHSAQALESEADRIAEILRLLPGDRVADVGAGDGEWAEALALRVGDGGHVFATEVDEEEIEAILDRVEGAELDNVTTILGNDLETGLAEGCCDAILLRLVYHHFTDPAPMRTSLRQALRPGGLIAVIDIEPQEHWAELPGVPDRGGHGILPTDVIGEMTAHGFELVARYDDWQGEDDRFCVVFRRSS